MEEHKKRKVTCAAGLQDAFITKQVKGVTWNKCTGLVKDIRNIFSNRKKFRQFKRNIKTRKNATS